MADLMSKHYRIRKDQHEWLIEYAFRARVSESDVIRGLIDRLMRDEARPKAAASG